MSTPRPAAQERMRFSVIIPAHNEEKKLSICLESLARMDYPAELFEVIVVDNGSTDRTKEVAQSFSTRLNLKVLEKKHGTISAVRNCGARAARGEIFAFTDADCEVSSDWLLRATSLWTSPKTGIVGAHGLIPKNSSWVARNWYGDVATSKQGEVSYVPTLDLLVPRSVFFQTGGFEESIQTNEDFEFCQRVRAAGYTVMAHPEIAVVHLGTPQSFSEFYRKQRWHGTHVFRVLLRNISKLHNARAVLFAVYTVLCLAGIVGGAALWAVSGRGQLVGLSLGALLLVVLLLSLRTALRKRSLQPLFPLIILNLAYGIARAICLLEVSKWWGSWKSGTWSAGSSGSSKATAAKTSTWTQNGNSEQNGNREFPHKKMNDRQLKIAFLIGSDNESTRMAVENVCALPNVQVIAVLIDTERCGLKQRLKNLRRNVRREGWKYIPPRVVRGLRALTDRVVENAVVSGGNIRWLLKAAFPERCFSLSELCKKYGFAVSSVGNINSPEAVGVLKAADADLGIVVGTRILKESIFAVPRIGCINLHKGKVPEYRGMPPGFWELYDGAGSAGVTVHFVDKGLDTGDVVASSEVPILRTDTPVSLLQKLHLEGARLLAAAVGFIQAGSAKRQSQAHKEGKPRTRPTLLQIRELHNRLPHWQQQSDVYMLLKNLYSLLVYYCGLYWLARTIHRLGRGRGAVLLYHRVNDLSRDPLTVDTHTFAAQLVAISKRYPVISTGELVDRIRRRGKITPTTVAIHFDDCYRDVVTNGGPVLAAAEFRATAFVSSGFVGTDRSFAHDYQKYPFRYENLQPSDIRAWIDGGFEIGAHTVNHADLGKCSLDEARFEVVESRRQLETLIGRPVTFFSFPFGRMHNIRSEVVQIIRETGYTALFSAYGGFVGADTDAYDIPRLGVSCETRPLYLLLQIEGLAPNQLVAAAKKMLVR